MGFSPAMLPTCPREVEVIHARWAMLGVLALIFSDLAGQPFFPPKDPLSFADVAPWVAAAAVILAIIETYRMAALWDEQDVEARYGLHHACLTHVQVCHAYCSD